MDESSTSTETAARKRGRPRAGQEKGYLRRKRRLPVAGAKLILDVLRQAQGFLALSDIAAEAGLDASTTHRLLQVLTETGYKWCVTMHKSAYLPGPRVVAADAVPSLRAVAQRGHAGPQDAAG